MANRTIKMEKIPIVLLSFLILALVSCSGPPDSIPEGTDTYWYGNINSGEKFGVKIGDDYNSAKDMLINAGLRFDGEVFCDRYNSRIPECEPSNKAGMFRLKKFPRDGSVYLIFEGGAVVRVVWSSTLISLP